jgi:hypothetical protein
MKKVIKKEKEKMRKKKLIKKEKFMLKKMKKFQSSLLFNFFNFFYYPTHLIV